MKKNRGLFLFFPPLSPLSSIFERPALSSVRERWLNGRGLLVAYAYQSYLLDTAIAIKRPEVGQLRTHAVIREQSRCFYTGTQKALADCGFLIQPYLCGSSLVLFLFVFYFFRWVSDLYDLRAIFSLEPLFTVSNWIAQARGYISVTPSACPSRRGRLWRPVTSRISASAPEKERSGEPHW